jgi:uncharacterized protein (DUF697 family)
MRALPQPLQEVWNVWQEIQGAANRPATLALLAEPGPERDHWREALLIDSLYPEMLHLVEPDAARPTPADVYVVLTSDASTPLAQAFPAITSLPREKVLIALVSVPEHQAAARQREAHHALELGEDRVVVLESLRDLAGSFAKHLLALCPDHAIPFARQFPVLREAAAWEEIGATSKQNALIGAIPIPGADLPLMTANQLKMILRIAAMFDMPLSVERARELLAVIGGGFAMRAAARQIAKFIPVGAVVGAGVGYSGTLAMGKGAIEYFKRVTPQSAPPRQADDTSIATEARRVETES